MRSGQIEDTYMPTTADQLDQKLVSRVQKGDRTAFDLLLVKYQNRVASIISRYIYSPADIADVTQEVFIRAYRSIQAYRGDSAFYTWLYRIAINQAKTFLQKNKSLKLHQTADEIDQQLLSIDSPENLLSRTELAEGIEKALSAMPPELSVAIMLREFDGLSYEEISQVMECPIGTTRSRIFRAREMLDKVISNHAA